MHSLLDAGRIAQTLDELANRLAAEITPETETVFVGVSRFFLFHNEHCSPDGLCHSSFNRLTADGHEARNTVYFVPG